MVDGATTEEVVELLRDTADKLENDDDDVVLSRVEYNQGYPHGPKRLDIEWWE